MGNSLFPFGFGNQPNKLHLDPGSQRGVSSFSPLAVRLFTLAGLIGLSCGPVWGQGQAPGFLWMTNVGARVFAVDSQTNVYVDAGGKVIQLSSAGVPLQTNVLSSDPGMPQRDVEGFYYYAGKHPGAFVVGGFNYTNPACFLAKYNAAGGVVWSNDFGPTGFLRTLTIRDVKLDAEGNCLVAFTYNVSTTDHSDVAVKFNAAGSNVWSSGIPKTVPPGFFSTLGSARFGPISATNAYVLTFWSFSPSSVTLSRLDTATGEATKLTNWTAPNGGAWVTERPFANSLGGFTRSRARTW